MLSEVDSPSFSKLRFLSVSSSAFLRLSVLWSCSRAFSRSSFLRESSALFLALIYTNRTGNLEAYSQDQLTQTKISCVYHRWIKHLS